MGKLAKILVTIGIVFVFFLLFGLLNAGRQEAGYRTPGFIGVILLAAAYGAIRAIWKNEKNDKNNDSSILQR